MKKLLLLLPIFLLFANCSSDDGRDGKDGIDGKDGVNGKDGLNGAPGNANVIVSDWKVSTLAKDTIIDGTTVKVATVLAPELTAARFTKSVVYVYLDYGGGAFPMPFTSRAGNRASTISYFTKVGKVRPIRIADDGGTTISIPSHMQFRYLIIPSGTLKNSSQVDYNDYEAVKKYYNLKN